MDINKDKKQMKTKSKKIESNVLEVKSILRLYKIRIRADNRFLGTPYQTTYVVAENEWEATTKLQNHLRQEKLIPGEHTDYATFRFGRFLDYEVLGEDKENAFGGRLLL